MKKFYVSKNYRTKVGNLSCSLKSIDGGKKKTVLIFSLVFHTFDGYAGPIPEDYVAKRREKAQLVAEFLNSEECTEELQTCFLESFFEPDGKVERNQNLC